MPTSPSLPQHPLAVRRPPLLLVVQELPLEAPLFQRPLASTAQLQTGRLTPQVVKLSRLSAASIAKVEAPSMPCKRTALVLVPIFVPLTPAVSTFHGSQATATSRT